TSAWALPHTSARSFALRLRKLSYSAARRRYLSFSSASSPSRRATASSGSSTSAPSEAAGGAGGAGGCAGPGCCAGCGCSVWCFMGFRLTKQSLCRSRRAVVTGNSLSHTKLAARTARVNSSARRRVEARDVPVDERDDVRQRLLAFRIVEDFVIHLGIPAYLDRTPKSVGERAGEVRVHHPVLACEQEQERRLDAVAVGRHGALGPLDLAPRARRHHLMH